MKVAQRWMLAGGLGLIAVANAIALGGVMYNRSGVPEATLKLSERELGNAYGRIDSENSGLSLPIAYQVTGSARRVHAGLPDPGNWLDRGKLAELGIEPPAARVTTQAERSFLPWVTHAVLLVLELDGPAYRAEVERVCAPVDDQKQTGVGPAMCEHQQQRASRLFVVDAGRDAAELRRRYPDRSAYAIVHGQVSVGRLLVGGRDEVDASVSGLAIDELNVPLRLRAGVGSDAGRRPGAAAGSTYVATVAFGKRLEPWIVDLAAGVPR
jgi:hypothetical protein